mmetsp:Transcript_30631/g.72260  ORF Transcript_30631/g.72260 Transcript_30631/m.72260 type:complete len:248 (-) Transcript_30631:113-856(-)
MYRRVHRRTKTHRPPGSASGAARGIPQACGVRRSLRIGTSPETHHCCLCLQPRVHAPIDAVAPAAVAGGRLRNPTGGVLLGAQPAPTLTTHEALQRPGGSVRVGSGLLRRHVPRDGPGVLSGRHPLRRSRNGQDLRAPMRPDRPCRPGRDGDRSAQGKGTGGAVWPAPQAHRSAGARHKGLGEDVAGARCHSFVQALRLAPAGCAGGGGSERAKTDGSRPDPLVARQRIGCERRRLCRQRRRRRRQQ